MVKHIFGSIGQLIVGVLMIVGTLAQTIWWLWIDPPPGLVALFLVSMEALFFGGFNQVCSALAYKQALRAADLVDPEIP